jgi:hypothetical protein
MTTYTYKITGNVTYNESDETEDGLVEVQIEEYVEVDEMSAHAAFEKFFEENAQYEFYGSLKTCDQETYGKKGATYRDQNEGQTVDIDLVKK